jgi:SAM-dependent methyltransferase
VCGAACAPLGAVDFSKNCEERRGVHLPPTGRMVEYVLCTGCGYSFAPMFASWSHADFQREIYNDQYVQVDPDYAGARARDNARFLNDTFGAHSKSFRHLDYGGGDGSLSRLLRRSHWRSKSYDPFVDHDVKPGDLGTFGLITCFEVFEHVPDVHGLVTSLAALLAPGGLLLFTTLVSDGQLAAGQPPAWWYAAPRNGHVSLFSSGSLAVLAGKHGFQRASLQGLLHLFWRQELPAWARQLAGAR